MDTFQPNTLTTTKQLKEQYDRLTLHWRSDYIENMRTLIFFLPALLLGCTNSHTNTTGINDTISILKTASDTGEVPIDSTQYLSAEEQMKQDPYSAHFDTLLKGGYSICYYHDMDDQYLLYKKGSKLIDTIGGGSIGLSYKNLGYIGADFDNYFVFVHSFGSGGPHYIDLIEKTTGKNVFTNTPAWIDADEKKEFLLYSDNDVPGPKDQMTLYNLRTGQKQYFDFPSEIFDEPQVLSRIQIDNLTDKQLVITYDTENGSKTKVYNR